MALDISTLSHLSGGGAYVHPIICLGDICPYMHILRGGKCPGGGGAYVLHSLLTNNQLTDVTTNRQDKSPTVTVLGKRMKKNRFVKHNSSTMVGLLVY